MGAEGDLQATTLAVMGTSLQSIMLGKPGQAQASSQFSYDPTHIYEGLNVMTLHRILLTHPQPPTRACARARLTERTRALRERTETRLCTPTAHPDTSPAEQPAGSGRWKHVVRGRKAYDVPGALGSTVCVPPRFCVILSCFSTAVKGNTEPTASAILKCSVQRPEAHLHCRAGTPTRHPGGPSLSTS